MFAKFFIDRPVLSTVISVFIVLCGAISIFNLPVAQYPELTPPTICVEAQYPGASAEVISNSVASILEEKINGVEDMIYMSSSISSNTGISTTLVSFRVGTDPDKAMINVNNRVQMATALLPEVVRQYGVKVTKRSSTILRVGALYSTSHLYDAKFLCNYALINCVDALKRVKGIGDVQILSGNDYAIRIWPKPDVLSRLNVSVNEMLGAIKSHNSQRAVGKVGQQPSDDTAKYYTLIANGRYTDPEQFKNIAVRTDVNGTVLRLRDVADVELGAMSYEIDAKTRGCVAVPIMFFLANGANALEAVRLVDEEMAKLAEKFPAGVHYKNIYETTKFVEESIHEVIKTLCEAVLLVVLVILLFLKKFKATIIPCLAVPVSIIGAFAGMLAFGFSINTLTLFGLILAIGIVVDDAIIVIENVERIMETENLPVKKATEKAVGEVAGPVVAIVLVLCAVFTPCAFMSGLTGTMFKQFAITIAVSVVISGIVALTLTPALCVMFLGGKMKKTKNNIVFSVFDKIYGRFEKFYIGVVTFLLNNKKVASCILVAILSSTVLLWHIVPSSFLPEEDQGVSFGCAMMDPGASLSRAKNVAKYMDYIQMSNPAVEDVMSVAGYDLMGGAAKNNAVTMFTKLKPFDKRKDSSMSSFAVVNRLMAAGSNATDALIVGFNPPPIVGMSTTGGFECYVQCINDTDLNKLGAKLNEVLLAASKRKELSGVRTSFSANSPQFKVNVDELKVLSYGVSLDDLYTELQAAFGTIYVNDFIRSGRTFKVILQSKNEYRAYPEKINEIYVTSKKGHVIPVSAFVSLEPIVGCDVLERFNNRVAGKIFGSPAAGYTSGQAMDAMEEIFNQVLGNDYSFSWSGSSFQEKEATGSGSFAMLIGIFVVFLILAAQYERWSLPAAVMCSIPFAVFGALLGVLVRGYSNDLYFQIALITLVGLSAKNAILIVEFAVMLKEKGCSVMDAAIQAMKLRIRPIIMTSLAFIFGCLPLAVSTGAGAASRHSLGTGIVSGMLGATFIAVLFVPLFFVFVSYITERVFNKQKER